MLTNRRKIESGIMNEISKIEGIKNIIINPISF